MAKGKRKAPVHPLEHRLLLTVTMCLLAAGAVMVYSASSARDLLAGGGDGTGYLLRYVGFATGSALTATLLEAATPEGADLPAAGGYTVLGLLGCTVALVTAGLTAAVLLRPAPARPTAENAPVTRR